MHILSWLDFFFMKLALNAYIFTDIHNTHLNISQPKTQTYFWGRPHTADTGDDLSDDKNSLTIKTARRWDAADLTRVVGKCCSQFIQHIFRWRWTIFFWKSLSLFDFEHISSRFMNRWGRSGFVVYWMLLSSIETKAKRYAFFLITRVSTLHVLAYQAKETLSNATQQYAIGRQTPQTSRVQDEEHKQHAAFVKRSSERPTMNWKDVWESLETRQTTKCMLVCLVLRDNSTKTTPLAPAECMESPENIRSGTGLWNNSIWLIKVPFILNFKF